MKKMKKRLIKKVIKSGGVGAFSNWSVYMKDGLFYADCFCHKPTTYQSFNQLYRDRVCDFDELYDNKGRCIL